MNAVLGQQQQQQQQEPLLTTNTAPSTPCRGSTYSRTRASKTRLMSQRRHVYGILLLLVTVSLWTASNFLASTIFADNTYSKPFFLSFANSLVFALTALPALYRQQRLKRLNLRPSTRHYDSSIFTSLFHRSHSDSPASSYLISSSSTTSSTISNPRNNDDNNNSKLNLHQTAQLALSFFLLWFTANYLSTLSLTRTSVPSATILTSTSGIWTLLLGSMYGTERFTGLKAVATLASLVGVVMVSSVDVLGRNGGGEGGRALDRVGMRAQVGVGVGVEAGVGDAMAATSAILYGIYATLLQKRMSKNTSSISSTSPSSSSSTSTQLNAPLFFSLVGLLNILTLWPLFPLLHLTNLEPFLFPPTPRIWLIILANAVSCWVSDVCWAKAMALTSPLVVTLGLSLAIPLSALGQVWLGLGIGSDGGASGQYWVGALLVFAGFVAVNVEQRAGDDGVEDGESHGSGITVDRND